jgi:hypothetical protein
MDLAADVEKGDVVGACALGMFAVMTREISFQRKTQLESDIFVAEAQLPDHVANLWRKLDER